MLHSLKKSYGEKLVALDGQIGQVKDFYFDDRTWTIRYVVAETGTWLTSRQVLLSPRVVGSLFQNGRDLSVNLTCKQIEGSPPIEWHKPVSRQYEEEYHRYYGWPGYWEGNGLWGDLHGFPILETPGTSSPGKSETKTTSKSEKNDAHLFSTLAVKGYNLQAVDGIIGHICDFKINENSWAIHELVIKVGHRFTGSEVLIPANCVERISYPESTVFVNLTKAAVEQSPLATNVAGGQVQQSHHPVDSMK